MKRRRFANRRAASAVDRQIYGLHPVKEWLVARPTTVRTVYYDARSAERMTTVLALAKANAISLHATNGDALSTMAGTKRHQGVVATLSPFPYAEIEHVVSLSPRLLVAVDQLQDPHNLGALLRTAEAVGVGAVIIPKDGAVGVTATVEASAAGAAALVPVCRVTNLARTLETLKEHGYWTIGLVPRGGLSLYDMDVPERVAIVLGSETGMRPLVARCCDMNVSIPMAGKTESLNASVAAAVVLYELCRRWREPQIAPGRLDRE